MVFTNQLRRLKHATSSAKLKLMFIVLGCIWIVFATHNTAITMFLSKIRGSKPPLFFIETSGRITVSLRVACVIESAAILHPYRPVNVYSIAPLALNHPNIEKLLLLPNVHFETLYLDTFFNSTPLQKWYESGVLKLSQYPTAHLSDALRLAILWKVGGIYLDTDMLAIKSLNNFQNALGCGLHDVAGNSALIFEPGHNFLHQCMNRFTSHYSTDSYDKQGPVLVTKVLQNMCDGHPYHIQDVINRPEICEGVTLLPPYTFFAFDWQKWQSLFDNRELVDTSNSYTVHLYSKMTSHVKGRIGTNTLLESLALQHCPNTFLRMVELDKL